MASAKSSAFSIQPLAANYGASSHATVPKESVWQKPPSKTYKMNIDASFFLSGVGAAAALLRNSKGEAIAGGAWPISHMLDASTAETVGLKKGLELLENIQCSPTIIESDNLELVNACNGEVEMWTPNTAVLLDCFQIAQRIGMVSFKHCPRESNKVAHNLARFSFDHNRIIIWDGDPPDHVLLDVISDVTLF